MNLFIKDDYEQLSKLAAEFVADEVRKKPNIVLGLATGSTPKGMYGELLRMHREEGLDFSKVTTFNLDEYMGLDEEDFNSYHYYMKEHFFKGVNINPDNIFIPNGKADNLGDYCREYDKLIEGRGGIDLQILGIGEDGHIAFIESGDSLKLYTSVVRLAQSTIEVNSRFFNSIEEVPKKAISMGLAPILKAKKVLLLANGRKKFKVIKELLAMDRIRTQLPASLLLLHPDLSLIIDREAYEGVSPEVAYE